jgi:hypothetical protein
VVIGEKRTITVDEKILSQEVVVEMTADGKESLKITKCLTGGKPSHGSKSGILFSIHSNGTLC